MKVIQKESIRGKRRKINKTKNTRGDIINNTIEDKPQKASIPRTRMYLVVDDIENVNQDK